MENELVLPTEGQHLEFRCGAIPSHQSIHANVTMTHSSLQHSFPKYGHRPLAPTPAGELDKNANSWPPDTPVQSDPPSLNAVAYKVTSPGLHSSMETACHRFPEQSLVGESWGP